MHLSVEQRRKERKKLMTQQERGREREREKKIICVTTAYAISRCLLKKKHKIDEIKRKD